MELKVWVEGIQRIVCGVTEKTTCQVGSKDSYMYCLMLLYRVVHLVRLLGWADFDLSCFKDRSANFPSAQEKNLAESGKTKTTVNPT